jgi:hypothetical protein
MAWDEANVWLAGAANKALYQNLLDDATTRPSRVALRKKIVHDLHQDCDVEITDTYEWKPQDEIKRYDWEAGDIVYIPPCTIHQHCNGDPARPARLISCTNRIYKNSGLNDLVQIENAPEYDPKVVLTAELVRDYLEGWAEKVA